MLENFLKEKEINKKAIQLILKECSKYNRSLAFFLTFHEWHEVPAHILGQFIKAYEQSEVNLKTGKIISPSSRIENIQVEKPKTVTLAVDALFKNEKREGDYEIYFISRNKDNERTAICRREYTDESAVTYDDSKIDYDLKANINLEDLNHETTKRITAYVIVKQYYKYKREDYLYDKFQIELLYDEKLIKSMDMTDVMNKTHGVFALDLRWYENDWIINFIGLPEDRNILDILNSTVIN